MTTFDDRKNAQEAKFAHDAQLNFKAEARRNKLLGLWVAEKIGHDNPDAYAAEVIASDFAEAGDEDVFRKVSGDVAARGADLSEAELRAKMEELRVVAREQISNET